MAAGEIGFLYLVIGAATVFAAALAWGTWFTRGR